MHCRHFALLLSLVSQPVWSASLFTNMDFEAVVQPLPDPEPPCYSVPSMLALPGWHVPRICSDLSDAVQYNSAYLSLVAVSIYSRDYAPFGVIQGTYSIFMRSGLTSPLPTGSDASIFQIGLVPFGARSIEFKVNGRVDDFDVFLGGVNLDLYPKSRGPNYTLYVADVMGYVGREEELRITVPYVGTAPSGDTHAIYLDDIRFSPFPIPEPRAWTLLALGLAGLLVCWRSRAKR